MVFPKGFFGGVGVDEGEVGVDSFAGELVRRFVFVGDAEVGESVGNKDFFFGTDEDA